MAILAADKIVDSPIKQDIKLGLQTHFGAKSQSKGIIQLVPKPRQMAIIMPRRRRGTWEGVPVTTWCTEWICRMWGVPGPHILIVPVSFSLPPKRGAAIGRAPTILQNVSFYTRIPILSNLQFCQPLASAKEWKNRTPSVCPRTVWCVVNMFHKNGMSPLIRTIGTILYSVFREQNPPPKMAAAHKMRQAKVSQISGDTCSYALLCVLDGFLQLVLLDSTTASSCCTFSSIFCVAMAEQLCLNPWWNNFVDGTIWDHPQRNNPKMTKMRGWGYFVVQLNPPFQTHRFPMRMPLHTRRPH